MAGRSTLTTFEIDRRARKCFEAALPEEWTPSPPRDDFGLDYWIQISESAGPTGLSLFVQLKGTTKARSSDLHITVRLSGSNAVAYLKEPKPILLVACDVSSERPSAHVAYYCWVQDYLRHTDRYLEEGLRRPTKIRVPRFNMLDASICRTTVLEYVKHQSEVQKRKSNFHNYDFKRPMNGRKQWGSDAVKFPTTNETPHAHLVTNLLLSADIYFQAGQFRDAISALFSAQNLYPTLIAAMELGNCYLALREYKMAVAAFDSCLQMRPGFAVALCHKGNALFQLGRVDEALTCHEEAAQHQTGEAAPQACAAATLEYIASMRPQEKELYLSRSLAYYHRALAIAPNDDEIIADAALVLFKQYNFNFSMLLLERAIAINPDNVVAWRRLQRTYVMMGKTSKAEAAGEHIAQLRGGPEPTDLLRTILQMDKQ